MPTPTERTRARAGLKSFETQLTGLGYSGDVKDEPAVLSFIEDNGIDVPQNVIKSYKSAVKALSAEISPDGMQALVSWTDGDGAAELEEEDEIPEEAKSFKRETSALDRRIKKLEERNYRDEARKNFKVEVKLPDAHYWENVKRKGLNVFNSPEEAAGFAASVIAKDPKFRQHMPAIAERAEKSLTSLGVKGNATSPLTAGGALMGETYSSTLIDRLGEYTYGAAKNLEQVNMTSDVEKSPRATNELDVYYPGEGGTPTYTQLQTDRVTLTARDAMALVEITNPLREGSLVNIGEVMGRKLVQAFDKKSDDILFNGTGTAAYGKMSGLAASFTAEALNARSVIGADTSDAHTLANLYTVRSKLDDIYLPNAAWHCTSAMKAVIFERLAGSVGGLGMAEIAGKQVDTFLGYPIITNRVMNYNTNTGGNVVDVYFGDFSKLGKHGIRKSVEIATSDQVAFTTNEVVMRGVFRHDIVLYDLGDATTAGAVVALWQT